MPRHGLSRDRARVSKPGGASRCFDVVRSFAGICLEAGVRFESVRRLDDHFRGLARTGATRVSSCIKVKGFRNVIHWTVTRYDEPNAVELSGRGRGGIRIAVAMRVTENHPGSTFNMTADLTGGVLNGPIGRLVARIVRSDVHKSVCNLAALQ
jgi:hypothetical protein